MIDAFYQQDTEGIFVPYIPITHRDEEYDQQGFETLLQMQQDHFWYRGRHRFLLEAVRRTLGLSHNALRWHLAAVDLGGGCGGWIAYLNQKARGVFDALALADSSRKALDLAGPVLPVGTPRYHVDLLNLHWQERWDVIFLLDVLEHTPQDALVMSEIARALKPGGVLFLTAPALERFRTWNDEVVHHYRRYARKDLRQLASKTALDLLEARYFMFFLSPLLLASRLKRPPLETMSPSEIAELLARTHRVPGPVVNSICAMLFAAETPLGLLVPFPWGTSILGVYRKR
jgi:SAM-dependent methyltransferase